MCVCVRLRAPEEAIHLIHGHYDGYSHAHSGPGSNSMVLDVSVEQR